MSNIIKIHNLGKSYRIGARKADRSLRDDLSSMLTLGKKQERFWALRHLSLEVKPGDRIGIIGGNGSGKSTLLKILSRITVPDEGRAELSGTLSSMLEVGTGFHPELSGRDNVFLNGAILGMSRGDILSRFDDIVSFAGVEKFIDMPVKRYSSGMYVRLAFAVAAHLNSDILLLDEVLAVGDAEFQGRCLDKMQSITLDEGRTIIFVSHNMMALQALCNRALVLRNGERITTNEDVTGCIHSYLRERLPGGERVLEWNQSQDSFKHPAFTPVRMSVSRADGSMLPDAVSTGEALRFDLYFDVLHKVDGVYFEFLVSVAGAPLFSASPWECRDVNYKIHPGRNHLVWYIPANLLNVMNYRILLRAVLPGPGGFRMTSGNIPDLRLPITLCDYPMMHPSGNDRRLLHPELKWDFDPVH